MSHSDKKRILKQFQWFQVQTKVREIISQLIQPLEKKVLSNSTSISKLQELTHNEKEKLEQITLMVHNDEDIFKQGIFKNIEEKFHSQTVLIRDLEKKIEYLESYINSKAKVLDKRLEESTEVLNGINDFKEYVKAEFTNQSKKIIDSHTNVLENFDAINKEISETHLQIDQIKLHQETLTKRVDLNEKIVNQANHRLDARLLQFYQSIKQIKTVTQINGGHLTHMREQMLRMGSYQKILGKFQSLVNEQIIRIDNLQFKIEVIQPVISFTQINEYAHHILPEKYHKNISIYYYNKYKELVQEILNNNFEEKRLSESVKGNLQLIKQTHKRAIKIVFKLKKQQLTKKGVNIDLLSHQKKEQLLASMKIQEDLQGIDDVDPEISKKIIPQDDSPKATEQQMEAMHKELKQKIELQLKDSKSYIEHMEFLLKKDQQILQRNMNSLSNSLAQLTLNCQLQQRLNRQFSTNIQKDLSFLRQQNKTMKLAMREIHDIMLIFNQIEKQDEKDRQGITLLGIRQHHKDQVLQPYDRKTFQGNRSVVDLKPECLSCSGNPNYYNEFFKMACLTYTSSPIRYDSHLYNRIEILDRLQQQLQFIHGVLSDKSSKRQNELGLQTERKQSQTHRQYIQEEMGSSRYGSSQIMKLPSKDVSSISERYAARNVSSSQEIRTKNTPKSPEQPRIINPSQLTSQMLYKTRNRFYNRKLERSIKEKSLKKEDNSQEKAEYMKNVSRYFKDLNKQNSGLI